LGGLWTASGYQREIDSPNSDLLMLRGARSAHGSIKSSLEPAPLIGLACSWAILDEAHITLLAIDPAYQRQGLGSLLLYALLLLAQQRGLAWATLEVRASNQSALALYQRFGFESVGTRRKYYPDGEDALILWRKGLQDPEFSPILSRWKQVLGDRLQQHGWLIHTAGEWEFNQSSPKAPFQCNS
jgi:ribosomal-protein-alanine N-acetyltransferase